MSDDIHEVYAICYGSHGRKRAEDHVLVGTQEQPRERALRAGLAPLLQVVVERAAAHARSSSAVNCSGSALIASGCHARGSAPSR